MNNLKAVSLKSVTKNLEIEVKTTKIWASAWDFQQCVILTCVDSNEPLQPPFKLRNSKWYSVSSLTIIKYSSDLQRLWSDCAYAQAGLSLCWSHIPNCWKSHALAQILSLRRNSNIRSLSITDAFIKLADNRVLEWLVSWFRRTSSNVNCLNLLKYRFRKVQIECESTQAYLCIHRLITHISLLISIVNKISYAARQ